MSTGDAVKRLSGDIVEVVRRMAENAVADQVYDTVAAIETQVYRRLERIERHLGIFEASDAVPADMATRERVVA
jgi:hypothetical protein